MHSNVALTHTLLNVNNNAAVITALVKQLNYLNFKVRYTAHVNVHNAMLHAMQQQFNNITAFNATQLIAVNNAVAVIHALVQLFNVVMQYIARANKAVFNNVTTALAKQFNISVQYTLTFDAAWYCTK